MFNVRPLTPYRDLSAADKVRRNMGDVAQNIGRTVVNAVLTAPNLVRKCSGRETSWVPSYHAQRVAQREQAGQRRMEEEACTGLLRRFKNAPDNLLDGRHAPIPRHRAAVTRQQVERVLAEMGRSEIAREWAGQPDTLSEDGLYDCLEWVYTEVKDERFTSGVRLSDKGRELLAAYYARKYGASIEISDVAYGVTDISEVLPKLIAADRRKPGDVRCAHYFGDHHGAAAIYVRERGREALLFFDTTARPEFPFGEAIAKSCTRALGVKSIPVYEHFESLQKDSFSCWSMAMKAAVTVTRRMRDESGNWGDFLIPDLIGELESRRVAVPSPAGVIPVRALPEITKLAQSRNEVVQHSGLELDTPLRDSKHGTTLRAFLERRTYDAQDRYYRSTQVLDYARQKGERHAEIIQIEAWSEQIRNTVGAGNWGEREQNEFAQRMKALVRAAPPDSDPVRFIIA